MLWAWKGDYVNLGAGAELGIYYGGGPQWFVNKDLAMPMSLTLKYKGSNIISYSTNTWWITGFNPKYPNKNRDELTAIFSINFSGNKGFFNAFYNTWHGKDSRWSFGNYTATFTF